MRITETYENGITRTYETETCAKCKSENDPLSMFPNDLCLACYSQTAEANRPLTSDNLTAIWTNPNLINL